MIFINPAIPWAPNHCTRHRKVPVLSSKQ